MSVKQMKRDEGILRRSMVGYPCASCDEWVKPESLPDEAGIVFGGRQRKLCRDCADEIEEEYIDG